MARSRQAHAGHGRTALWRFLDRLAALLKDASWFYVPPEPPAAPPPRPLPAQPPAGHPERVTGLPLSAAERGLWDQLDHLAGLQGPAGKDPREHLDP